MGRELYDPHLQSLHDFLGRSLQGWAWEKVYTLTFVFKKQVLEGESSVCREAAEFVFLGVGQADFLFLASLDKAILSRIYRSSNLSWSQTEDNLIWPNYGWVDPDKSTAIIVSGLNSRKAFENPEVHSPKRQKLLRADEYERLVAQDPFCFLLALGLPRAYKPPPM